MTVQPILLPGDPQLNEISSPVRREELDAMKRVAVDPRDTMMDFH